VGRNVSITRARVWFCTAPIGAHSAAVQNPRNLRVYGQALDMAVTVYRLTGSFPTEERYGLVSQMRRAAVSVGSNIAEGCGRNGNRALVAALHHSLGSLDELEFQAELSNRLGICPADLLEDAYREVVAARRAISALITALRRRPDVPDR
jgi:four helix bundle protein